MVQFNPPPPPATGHLSVFLTSLTEALRRAFSPLISKDEAVDRVILLSPNGTAYDVRVNDSGVLVVTKNNGNSGL